jgi:hypothetical protein
MTNEIVLNKLLAFILIEDDELEDLIENIDSLRVNFSIEYQKILNFIQDSGFKSGNELSDYFYKNQLILNDIKNNMRHSIVNKIINEVEI